MLKILYQSAVATLVLAVLLCGAYPAVVTGIGQVLFGREANGSIIVGKDGKPIGSILIGQAFSKPEYFHGRPSAAGQNGYDAANSSGSNLGPTNQKFADGLKSNIDAFLKDNPSIQKGAIPTDLVTASGSGLDPAITPEGAMAQVDRVAKARNISPDQLRELVRQETNGPQWGIFGEPVVNVLVLNIELDSKFPKK